jgi:hypothetical protein
MNLRSSRVNKKSTYLGMNLAPYYVSEIEDLNEISEFLQRIIESCNDPQHINNNNSNETDMNDTIVAESYFNDFFRTEMLENKDTCFSELYDLYQSISRKCKDQKTENNILNTKI